MKNQGRVQVIIIMFCFIFFLIGYSLAEEPKKHTLEIGTEISHITYEEPGRIEGKGTMYGFLGAYTYRGAFTERFDRGMLKAEARYSFGDVDHYDQLVDGTPYTIDGIDDYMWEFRGMGGYDFPVLTATTLTPYFGLGYRYLNEDLSKDLDIGYERESNYFYSPIGVESLTQLENGWSAGASVEYDIFWWGVLKNSISGPSELDDISNDQNSGYGVRGSLKLKKDTERVSFFIEPFIRYWNIDKSEEVNFVSSGTVVGQVSEPKNNSTEYGIRFAAKF